MAIIIEHMEMPNGCCECRMQTENCCTLSLRRIDDIYDRPEWCLLIETESVKHGRWLKTGQSLVFPEKFRNYFCSECGLELNKSIRTKYRYCPNCGARMDLDEVEE